MLAKIKTIVEILTQAVPGVSRLLKSQARRDAILELFYIFFILSDVVDDGEQLLSMVGQNPAKTLAKIPGAKVPTVLKKWDLIIRRQANRLYSLAPRLLGGDALAIIDLPLKQKLTELVGSKFERTDSLEGVVAGLVIYTSFAGENEAKWQRSVVLSMYPRRTQLTIDIKAAATELIQLKKALSAYRKLCLRFATKSEILRLSKTARKNTLLTK
jgi:hypothetical protein